MIDRDMARAALSVFQVATHRTDLDEVDAMGCAVDTYLHLQARLEDERRNADRARFWRNLAAHRALVHRTLRGLRGAR